MRIERPGNGPIITPNMDPHMGENINGPSLIRVPDWLPHPLGRYYLYFGHHHGKYIRLAYADKLLGPWTTYEPGTLRLEQTACRGHIASPDAHVDDATKQIRMYFHGPVAGQGQCSFVSLSEDGIHFEPSDEILGSSYFRVIRSGETRYALGMPGIFYRSRDGLTSFERGPQLFTKDMRHTALKLDSSRLSIFYSNAYDCPEHILMSQIDLTGDWMDWQPSKPVSVIRPEQDYEGADLPLVASQRGWAPQPVHQLRDPAIYREEGDTYLLYSVAGERGIAIAELFDE